MTNATRQAIAAHKDTARAIKMARDARVSMSAFDRWTAVCLQIADDLGCWYKDVEVYVRARFNETLEFGRAAA